MVVSTVVTSMKDEAPYILEWVAYHMSIGFDRIVVLANDCTDGTHEMLSRLQEKGHISYYENPVPLGKKPHSLALKRANATQEVKSSDYVMVLDADEFLVVKNEPHNVGSLIKQLDESSAEIMVVPWRIFGSSENFEYKDVPVLERFKASKDVSSNPKAGVKSFFKRDDRLRLAIHFPKKVMQNGKSLPGADELKWIDPDGNHLKPKTLTWNGGKNTIHRTQAEVAHFMIKSLDEYLLKIFRGDGLMNSNRHGVNYWSSADSNEVTDLEVLSCAPHFLSVLAELRRDQVLVKLHNKAVEDRMARLKSILESQDVSDLKEILKRSTQGELSSEDKKKSRAIVERLSPAEVKEDLLGDNVPHSFLLNVTTTFLRDTPAIVARLSDSCRNNATMFWLAKDFDKRPITSLIKGLERAQKSSRDTQVACRYFDNFVTIDPKSDWPLDETVSIVLTRDHDEVLDGLPAYVSASKAKFLEKSQRKFPPLKNTLKYAKRQSDVETLIKAGEVEDPLIRLERFIKQNPDAIVINLSNPQDSKVKIDSLQARGGGYETSAALLRDALGIATEDARQPQRPTNEQSPPSKPERKPRSALRVHWFRRGQGKAAGNFGDELGPLIVSKISGRTTEWADAADCDLASIGSILSQVSKSAARADRSSELLVWGSGLIEEDITKLHPSLSPLAVRGEYTRDALGLSQSLPLGDPGILSDLLVPQQPKRYKWGVVPHFTHRNNEFIKQAAKQENCVLIDPTAPPLDVLALISSCDAVVSSSLHGLIVADSFGVPCVWLDIESHKSHHYKFADYCSGVNRPAFLKTSVAGLNDLTSGAAHDVPFKIDPEIKIASAEALILAVG